VPRSVGGPRKQGRRERKHFNSHLCYNDIVNYLHNFSFAVPINSKEEFLFVKTVSTY